MRRAVYRARVPAAAPATVRQIHAIMSAALSRAVRWGWVAINPADAAEAPAAPKPDPQPPTIAQAARILQEAWRDPEWGMLVWLAMVTGARRGELCALAWDRLDFATGVLTIRTSIAQVGRKTWEKDTKTHQRRRIALDDQTLALLRGYYLRCRERAEALDSSFRSRPGCSPAIRTAALAQARHGWAAVRADVRPARLGHAPSPAPALLGDGTDWRWGGCADRAGRLGTAGEEPRR